MDTRALPKLPKKIPVQALEECSHACFALTESLRFCYCNQAWDRFALENGAGPDVLAARVLHKPFLQFVPKDLVAHFRNLFRKARQSGRRQSQDYECSSPQLFRVFRMEIYPLSPGSGFVIINSLRVVQSHSRAALDPDDANYRDKNGLIYMCANCRRTRRADNLAAWDWVPAYVQHPSRDMSHGLCHFCRDYYYGAYMARRAQAG